MKEFAKQNRPVTDPCIDECCSIAESMIAEIHQIAAPKNAFEQSVYSRHKGSFKRMILRKIRLARKMAAIG